MKFPFRLDCKRAYAAWSMQVKPPAIATKYIDPDDRTDQQPYGGHGKAGAPKVPAKVGHSLKIVSSNKDNSDDDEIVRVGATKPALLQALAAAKDKHGVEIARVNEEDSDDDESASTGARKLAWLQALAAAAKPNGGVSGNPRKKVRGREAQFPFRLDRSRAYAAQNAKAKPPAIAAKHNDLDDQTNQRPYGGHGKAEVPEVPAHLSVLHRLHRWKAPNGGRSCFDGCIVAFEGEAWDAHGLPLLWKFDKQEELLLQRCRLSVSALHHASVFFRNSNKDDRFHTCRTPPLPGWHGETVETCRRLIPIPVGWAHMFLDCPPMGTAFRQTIQLMLSAEAAERHHLRPFCEGVAWACGSLDPRATKPRSALNSQWRRVAYTKATLTLATT